MSRRGLWTTIGVSAFFVVALAFFAITDRNSTAGDLNADAASVLSQARTLRANTSELEADQAALLESLTPAALTESDLVGVVKSVASPLGLRVEEVTSQVTPIGQEDALKALNIDPATLSDFFSVVTASVKVTGDVPRLMTLLENLKNASANGPLMGFVGIKFMFDDSNTTLTVGLVGVRFNGVSAASPTPTTIAVPTQTTLPIDAMLPVDTTVAP
jgi:hypothetical protein